jgi:hypothetical protein
MLGPDDDIARFEYLKKSARNFGSVLIGIETRRPKTSAISSPSWTKLPSPIATSPMTKCWPNS